jgi:hypothetical protein
MAWWMGACDGAPQVARPPPLVLLGQRFGFEPAAHTHHQVRLHDAAVALPRWRWTGQAGNRAHADHAGRRRTTRRPTARAAL